MDPVEWLEEAYAEPISTIDVGYVWRNIDGADFISKTLLPTHMDDHVYCDYGGGYGLLVRLMRDKGFRFHWHDPYCRNLFAVYSEASLTHFAPYSAVTAMEVFEHMTNPVCDVEDMLRFGSRIIFRTELIPEPKPKPGQWWYFLLDYGQHISFYSVGALKALADRFGLQYGALCPSWHIFGTEEQIELARRAIGPQKRMWFRRPTIAPVMKSLTAEDFQAALKMSAETRPNIESSLENIDYRSGLGRHGQSHPSSSEPECKTE